MSAAASAPEASDLIAGSGSKCQREMLLPITGRGMKEEAKRPAARAAEQSRLNVSDCLHCDINELIRKHLEANEAVDLGEFTARVAESLADLILLAPEEEQTSLLAHTLAHLGEMVLQKSGAVEGDTTH